MDETLVQDWKIGIISTDYDLIAIRAKLIDLVSDLGFEPIAFELSSMRKEPGVHSHEACVLAVEVSDIIILVIDKRFGGLYLGQGPYSVTEQEFFKAYNLKKIVIPCVSKAAFDDRHNSFRKVYELMQNEGITEDEARAKVSPSYVDKWQVLDFIQRVRKMDRDQYLEIYDSEEDLLERIRGRLGGISRYICSRIVEEQVRWIDSIRSTSGMFQSVGIVGSQKLFIDPPFKRISGITRKRKAVSILDSLQSRNTSILITGDPGAGKTILLAQAFKKHARQAVRNKRYRLPFFLSLRGRGTRYHFKIMNYLSECCVNYLKKKPFPTMSLKDINPIFYIDGFDESTNVPSPLEMARLAKCEIMNHPYVLCSRSEFAKQTVDTSMEFGSVVDFHLRLLDWSKDEAISFVRKYSEFNNNQLVRARIEDLIDDVAEDHPIIKSPLILSLVLWLAYTDNSVISKDLDLNTIFSWFIQKWASKEIQRYGETPINEIENASQFLIMCWEITAWIIYKYRNVGVDLRISALIDEVTNILNSNSQTKQIIKSPMFESLLTFTVQHETVTGMLHEQFLEYLLGKAFVKGCIIGDLPYPDYLGYQINFEVNRFIKTIWASTNKRELHSTLVNLKKAFISNLGGMDSETLNTRVNSIYYISRVPLWDEDKKILEDFLQQPTDLYTKNGILFALVRLGDRNREKDLYNSLITNQDADAINRGLHLVYFKDWVPVGELPPYMDNGTLQWKRTLAGMMSHVESMEERFINSKRLDIYIIRSFIQNRKKLDGFTKDNLNRIKASVVKLDNLGVVNISYLKDIKHELSLLEESVEDLLL